MTGRRDRMRGIAFAIIILSAFLLAFVGGCKSDSGNPYGGGGGGGGTPGAHEVWIQGMAFDPGTKTVAVGTTITWTNKDAIAHTVTSNSGTPLSSGNIGSNGTYSYTFTVAGTYAYHCAIHPSMTGSITVQ